MRLDKPTTGSKDGDCRINKAVDMALLRLKPIIRDIIREELKEMLPLEPENEHDKTA